MSYIPNPLDATQPVITVKASTAAAEFRAIKTYLNSIVAAGLPPQAGNAGNVLITNGTVASWASGITGRNILFNADFRINQRNYVSAATLAANTYGHDRFKAGASGGDYSFTQLNSSTQITIAASKSLIQVVEDRNVVGGSYVLSWTGTALARVGINTATPAGTFVVSPILITGQTAGTTMSVEFNTGTLGTAQLELGTVVTPFERRPIGLELALCQRYCYIVPPASYGWPCPASGFAFVQNYPFKVTMRAAPTAATSHTAQLNISSINSLTITVDSHNIQYSGSGVAYVTWTFASTYTAEL